MLFLNRLSFLGKYYEFIIIATISLDGRLSNADVGQRSEDGASLQILVFKNTFPASANSPYFVDSLTVVKRKIYTKLIVALSFKILQQKLL